MRRCAECGSPRKVAGGLCEACTKARGVADTDRPSVARAIPKDAVECPKCGEMVDARELVMTLSGFCFCAACRAARSA